MNDRRVWLLVAGAALVALLLGGCTSYSTAMTVVASRTAAAQVITVVASPTAPPVVITVVVTPMPPAATAISAATTVPTAPTATPTALPPTATVTPIPPTATSTSTPTPVPTPEPDAVVVAETLNLRDGPGAGYSQLGQLRRGDPLTVFGRFRECSWLQVSTADGQWGWVSGGQEYVSLALACDSISAGTFRGQTGIVKGNVRGGGDGQLTVENGTSSDGVVVLMYNDQPVTAAYIRAGDSFTLTDVRDGTYYLYFSTGSEWNGSQFTVDARHQRFVDAFPFTTTASSYTIWSVTLHGVAGGTAAAEDVPAGEFPAIVP